MAVAGNQRKSSFLLLWAVLALVVSGLAVVAAAPSFSSTAPAVPKRLVGMYVYTPGNISDCSKYGAWPSDLPANPDFNGGQKYTTDNAAYMNYMLSSTASMGVDFLMVDMSNGIHYRCPSGPPFEQSLLLLLDTADARIRQGQPTPHIAIMSAMPGTTPTAPAADGDYIYSNLVYSGGVARPSYTWIGGFPLWGVYSASPFRTDYRDPRFLIRYICNSANNDCHQPQVDSGVVWPWATMGNRGTPGCPASANTPPQSCPLASVRSNEITIQDGYSDKIACLDYWRSYGWSCDYYQVGFSLGYYDDQWKFATAHAPLVIMVSSYDQVEGGWIQARADFSPPTAFADRTQSHISSWKGNVGLAALGPPAAPPAVRPATNCGSLQPGQGLLPNQFLSSCDGRFRLTMQSDGNAVLYSGSQWIWQTRTTGRPGAGGFELMMQPDGNLVMYASSGTPIWSSGTFGHSGARLAVQSDSNLVIHGVKGATLWSRFR